MQGPKDTISNQDIVPEAWLQMQTMSFYKSGGYQTPGSHWWSQRWAVPSALDTVQTTFHFTNAAFYYSAGKTMSIFICLLFAADSPQKDNQRCGLSDSALSIFIYDG